MLNPSRSPKLSAFVDSLQARGCYTFRRQEALQALGISPTAFRSAARRLRKKSRITLVRRGFYLIIPPEYRSVGATPPYWFIDEFMKFQDQPYYVALLSAAQLHGSAHQSPQIFQVLTSSPTRPLHVGMVRVHFYVKRRLTLTPIQRVQTNSGSIAVSTPESTALDVIRYFRRAAGLSHVATVLIELAEAMDPARLVHAAQIESILPPIQRLGHLLEHFASPRLVDELAAWLHTRSPRSVPLRPGRLTEGAWKDPRWQVLVNDVVEPDDV